MISNQPLGTIHELPCIHCALKHNPLLDEAHYHLLLSVIERINFKRLKFQQKKELEYINVEIL